MIRVFLVSWQSPLHVCMIWFPLSTETWGDEMVAMSSQCGNGSTSEAHSVSHRLHPAISAISGVADVCEHPSVSIHSHQSLPIHRNSVNRVVIT